MSNYTKAESFSCPECGEGTAVIDSRVAANGHEVRRRRKCKKNGNHRFTTVEIIAHTDIRPGNTISSLIRKTERERALIDVKDAVVAAIDSLVKLDRNHP